MPNSSHKLSELDRESFQNKMVIPLRSTRELLKCLNVPKL